MNLTDKIDVFFRRHPRMFLAAVLLLTLITVVVVKAVSAKGALLVYQAF